MAAVMTYPTHCGNSGRAWLALFSIRSFARVGLLSTCLEMRHASDDGLTHAVSWCHPPTILFPAEAKVNSDQAGLRAFWEFRVLGNDKYGSYVYVAGLAFRNSYEHAYHIALEGCRI